METGINNLKDLLEIFVWLIGAGSLIYAAYSYKTSQKQLNFAVIVSCTERFQKIMPQMKSENEEEKLRAIKAYIDLCNEELFYFKHNYLPDDIINEWIDGMVYYLPQFISTSEQNKANPEVSEVIVEHNLLEEYPRIKRAFTVNKIYKVSDEIERLELIEQVKRNLKSKGKFSLIKDN